MPTAAKIGLPCPSSDLSRNICTAPSSSSCVGTHKDVIQHTSRVAARVARRGCAQQEQTRILRMCSPRVEGYPRFCTHLIQPLAIVLVLAGVRISHVGEAFRAERWNAREAHFSAAGKNRIADCKMTGVVDSNDIARVCLLRIGTRFPNRCQSQ